MFTSRYTQYLEREIERLKTELERSNEERQAMLNSLLTHVGAPMIEMKPRERVPIPVQRRRNVPSLYRAIQERAARSFNTLKEKTHGNESGNS